MKIFIWKFIIEVRRKNLFALQEWIKLNVKLKLLSGWILFKILVCVLSEKLFMNIVEKLFSSNDQGKTYENDKKFCGFFMENWRKMKIWCERAKLLLFFYASNLSVVVLKDWFLLFLITKRQKLDHQIDSHAYFPHFPMKFSSSFFISQNCFHLNLFEKAWRQNGKEKTSRTFLAQIRSKMCFFITFAESFLYQKNKWKQIKENPFSMLRFSSVERERQTRVDFRFRLPLKFFAKCSTYCL